MQEVRQGDSIRAFYNDLGQPRDTCSFEEIGKSFFMQNSLSANNCDVSKISRTVQPDLSFILHVISESSIHFA